MIILRYRGMVHLFFSSSSTSTSSASSTSLFFLFLVFPSGVFFFFFFRSKYFVLLFSPRTGLVFNDRLFGRLPRWPVCYRAGHCIGPIIKRCQTRTRANVHFVRDYAKRDSYSPRRFLSPLLDDEREERLG